MLPLRESGHFFLVGGLVLGLSGIIGTAPLKIPTIVISNKTVIQKFGFEPASKHS